MTHQGVATHHLRTTKLHFYIQTHDIMDQNYAEIRLEKLQR